MSEMVFAGDITLDISSSPYESGFKFNSLPFGGMTVDTDNAVRVGSATDVRLVPTAGFCVVVGTSGSRPAASVSLRGALFVTQAANGSPDKLEICLKKSNDVYDWVQIVQAP